MKLEINRQIKCLTKLLLIFFIVELMYVDCLLTSKSEIELKEKITSTIKAENKKQIVEAQTSPNNNSVYYNSSVNKDLNQNNGLENALDSSNSLSDTFIVKGRDYLNNVSFKNILFYFLFFI